MQKLGAMWKKDPGLVVSCSAHVLAFVFLIVNINWPHKFDDQVESVPVEMVTTSDFNQIMNGEKTAKQMPTPQRRVDQVAELEDKKSEPPIPDSKKDTPPPPSPEKANNDPGQDEKPPEVANAPPPPPTPVTRPQPVTPPPPAPTPPERPVEKSEAPPPKADPVKPPPEEAEAVEPKPHPQPRPKVESKKPPKKVAKQQPKKPVPPVHPVQEAKQIPDPPRKPDPPKEPSLKERTLDQVAKLLDTMKPPKPVVKPKSGNEVKEAKHSDFSLDKITALLDHDAPQRTASKGRQLTQLASLGSPTAHAERMSPTLMAQIDSWLIDHYRGCWSYFGLGAATDYIPKIHVQMAPDGTLSARPVLLNQPTDPNLRSLADSALRAVNKCNPMPIPSWFKAHYEAWRDRTVRFDPKEMS